MSQLLPIYTHSLSRLYHRRTFGPPAPSHCGWVVMLMLAPAHAAALPAPAQVVEIAGRVAVAVVFHSQSYAGHLVHERTRGVSWGPSTAQLPAPAQVHSEWVWAPVETVAHDCHQEMHHHESSLACYAEVPLTISTIILQALHNRHTCIPAHPCCCLS
jgi:hypothetical protein